MITVMAGPGSVRVYSTRGGASGYTVRVDNSVLVRAPPAASCDYSVDEMRQALAAAVMGAAAQKPEAFNARSLNSLPATLAMKPWLHSTGTSTTPASFCAIRACPHVSIKACGGLG